MRRVKFGKYAGVKIAGTVGMKSPPGESHLDRASWLTAQVESGGKFGTIINYDGTGMTAGIHQAIAVYPRALDDNVKANDQGPLWKLLNRIWSLPDTPQLAAFRDPFVYQMDRYRMILSPEGKCLDTYTGKLMSGLTIRNIFTGASNGVMPVSGSNRMRAEIWARLFHGLFRCEDTFATQLRYGEEYFVKRSERTKLRFCKDRQLKQLTIKEACYHGPMPLLTPNNIGEELDLAMAVFWSHTVNAPGMALKKICRALDLTKSHKDFPRVLLRVLANTKYGRWHRNVKNGRWVRTRKYAKQIWPRNLFVGKNAIMP